jgi:hypothetical protein
LNRKYKKVGYLIRGHTPACDGRFLDDAVRLIFLQKVGGGYIFIHRSLLQYFAALRVDGEGAASPTGSTKATS